MFDVSARVCLTPPWRPISHQRRMRCLSPSKFAVKWAVPSSANKGFTQVLSIFLFRAFMRLFVPKWSQMLRWAFSSARFALGNLARPIFGILWNPDAAPSTETDQKKCVFPAMNYSFSCQCMLLSGRSNWGSAWVLSPIVEFFRLVSWSTDMRNRHSASSVTNNSKTKHMSQCSVQHICGCLCSVIGRHIFIHEFLNHNS